MHSQYIQNMPYDKIWWYLWIPLFFVLLPIFWGPSLTLIEFVGLVCLITFCYKSLRDKKLHLDTGQKYFLVIIGFFMIISLWSYLIFQSDLAERKWNAEFKSLIVVSAIILVIPPQGLDVKRILFWSMFLFVLVTALYVIYQIDVQYRLRADVVIATRLIIPGTNLLTIATAMLWMLVPRKNIFLLLAITTLSCISLYAVILSETRSAWVNWVVLTILITWINIKTKKGKVIIVSLILLSVTLSYNVPQIERRVNQFVWDTQQYLTMDESELNNSNAPWGIRLVLWEHAIKTIIQDPFSLRGAQPLHDMINIPDHYSYVRKLYEQGIELLGHTHNEILQQWIQKGILGFLAIVGLLVAPLLVLPPTMRKPAIVISFGTFVAGLSDVFLFHNFPLIFYLVTVALMQKCGLNPKQSQQSLS